MTVVRRIVLIRANRDRAMKAKGYKKSLIVIQGQKHYVYHKRHRADGWIVTLFDSKGNMKGDESWP